MTPARLPATLVLAFVLACGSVPTDPGPRIVPPAGVIRGTVVYRGPHPCSISGHIVGNAIVLVFDRRNPPPPNGLARTLAPFKIAPETIRVGDRTPKGYQRAHFLDVFSRYLPQEAD